VTVLVTGAGGFLGGRTAAMLAASGRKVRILWRPRPGRRPPAGFEAVEGDLADQASLEAAVRGVDSVIHCAGLAGVWGPLDGYVETNTMGTARLLAAARRQGCKRLVYTSTPSVVHSGGDLAGVDERAPYSHDTSQPYAYSKMLAERLVLAADSPSLRTLALRPHLIWGPGDPHLLPRLEDRARRGRLVLFSGGPWKVDATFVDNAAEAHLAALARLEAGADCAGQAYFIAQDEPVDLNILINSLLAAVGAPEARRRIGRRAGLAAAAAVEGLWRLLRLEGEPPITVFTVRQMSSSHYYDLSKARRLLGYRPKVSTAEGLGRLSAVRLAAPVRGRATTGGGGA
jgi:nucleoside-diphosphate-sugar epimerase